MAATCTGDSIVDRIGRTECIGNSLVKINKNFAELDAAICRSGNALDEFANTVGSNLLQWIMNCRLSLHATNSEPRVDIKNSNMIYLHPYKGNYVALWNAGAKKWELKLLKDIISRDLNDCKAETSYDIFLYHDGTNFQIELQEWSNQAVGSTPPPLSEQNGVRVKPSEANKRLIGCLHTNNTCTAEMSFGKTPASGGSYPKLWLWNAYNQIPIDFSILDSGQEQRTTWTTTASGDNAQAEGPFERFNGSVKNKVSFITRDFSPLTMTSVHTCETAGKFYFIHSLNRETPTVLDYFVQTPGKPIYESYGSQTMCYNTSNIIAPGFHYVQLASMTYTEQPVTFNLWKGNRHSYGTTGSFPAF